MAIAHDENDYFCNCPSCRKIFMKRYKTSYMYNPNAWYCRNKVTGEKFTVTARLAKEARERASEEKGIAPSEVTVNAYMPSNWNA